jgi:predicted MPP superfamily phosphohydrolase
VRPPHQVFAMVGFHETGAAAKAASFNGGVSEMPAMISNPISDPVRNRRYTRGEFELSGGRRLYISRGVGHLQRVRFNVRPEITVFRLEGA